MDRYPVTQQSPYSHRPVLDGHRLDRPETGAVDHLAILGGKPRTRQRWASPRCPAWLVRSGWCPHMRHEAQTNCRSVLMVARSPAGDLHVSWCDWQVPQLRAGDISAACMIIAAVLSPLAFCFETERARSPPCSERTSAPRLDDPVEWRLCCATHGTHPADLKTCSSCRGPVRAQDMGAARRWLA